MIEIIHAPSKTFYNNYIVKGSNIKDIINEIIPRIRKQSQGFYEKYLTESLNENKKAIIDQHAGNGIFYTIHLI